MRQAAAVKGEGRDAWRALSITTALPRPSPCFPAPCLSTSLPTPLASSPSELLPSSRRVSTNSTLKIIHEILLAWRGALHFFDRKRALLALLFTNCRLRFALNFRLFLLQGLKKVRCSLREGALICR